MNKLTTILEQNRDSALTNAEMNKSVHVLLARMSVKVITIFKYHQPIQ